MAKKYRAYLVGDGLLLGGDKVVYSIWFGKRKDAADWLSGAKETNKKANRKIKGGGIQTKDITAKKRS